MRKLISSIVLALTVSLFAIPALAASDQAAKNRNFVANLWTVGDMAVEQKALGEELLAQYPDGFGKSNEIADKEVAEIVASFAGLAKQVLPAVTSAVATGFVAFLVPSKTGLELADVLDSSRVISRADREAVVVRDLSTISPAAWGSLMKANEGYPDRVLLVLAGKFGAAE